MQGWCTDSGWVDAVRVAGAALTLEQLVLSALVEENFGQGQLPRSLTHV
jgi:hypothetical protein